MACYFCVDVFYKDDQDISLYDEYIQEIKPIVESFGGEYLVRSNKVFGLAQSRKPQRAIIIRFSDREVLDQCFLSDQYCLIANKRAKTVDARAIIIEE